MWVALAHMPPTVEQADFDQVIADYRKKTGSDIFGYWPFFARTDSHVLAEEHVRPLFVYSPGTPTNSWQLDR